LNRNGILAAGNWIVDQVKMIDAYPSQDTLANISSVSMSNGGSPYNVLKDLALLGADFPLEGIGLLGEDGFADYILEDCRKHGILTTQLHKRAGANTSITDVMTVQETGRRTFFHARGANGLLDESYFDLEKTHAKIFHLGYLLLLTRLDFLDEDQNTGASRILKKASYLGFKTSVDVVSESSERFPKIVKPSLPFTDYLFVNEFEAGRITGMDLMEEGKVSIAKAKQASRQLLDWGVRDWVLLHFPNGALASHKDGSIVFQPSLAIPNEKVLGAAGAGDAFAAGVLYGLHENWDILKCLKAGVCTAGMSLFHPSCSDGIQRLQEVLTLESYFGFQTFLD
jgi:sugar/nucleoside kinase (ribokinase family)